jgi:hypothetical protein
MWLGLPGLVGVWVVLLGSRTAFKLTPRMPFPRRALSQVSQVPVGFAVCLYLSTASLLNSPLTSENVILLPTLMAPPSCPHHPPCLSHSVPCSGSCVADSGRVKLYGMDVVPDNLAPILSGENRGVGVCPYETFVWRDLTVQEHMLVMGMVYGAWVGPLPRVSHPCTRGTVPCSSSYLLWWCRTLLRNI